MRARIFVASAARNVKWLAFKSSALLADTWLNPLTAMEYAIFVITCSLRHRSELTQLLLNPDSLIPM